MLGHESNLLLGVKQLALFGAILGLVFSTGAISYQAAFADDDDDDHDYKVYVCHKGEDLKISIYALKKHLKHKDSEGKCEKDDDKHDDDKKFKKHKVLTGDGPPPKKLGKKGDLYFDSWDDDSLEYYVKIGKKKWELRGTLVEPSNPDACVRGSVLKYDAFNNKWLCVDGTNLGGLSCSDGQIAKWNNTEEKWECEDDLVVDGDADSTNEFQDLGLTGRDLSITDGTGVNLPFAFDTQDCTATSEVMVGIDGNGDAVCGPGGGSVGENDITTFEIAQATILEEDIANGAITGPKLDDDSVDADKILDGSIDTEDLAPGAVSLIVDVKQISITQEIEDESSGTLVGACSQNNEVITGFNVLSIDESGPIVFSTVSITGTPQSLSVGVVNLSADPIDAWKLVLYCTSIAPLGP